MIREVSNCNDWYLMHEGEPCGHKLENFKKSI